MTPRFRNGAPDVAAALLGLLWAVAIASPAPGAPRPAARPTPRPKSVATPRAQPEPQALFGLKWRQLPRDYSGFEQGAASALSQPKPREMLPSQRLRRQRLNGFARSVAFAYAVAYFVYLLPAFPFGAFRLTFFERGWRLDNIMVDEATPLALRRGRKAIREVSPRRWHRLATVPAGALVSVSQGQSAPVAEGRLTERHEFVEPRTLRQFKLHILEPPRGEDPLCLLVQPKRLGDWGRVVVRFGRVQLRFDVEEPPIAWPPPGKMSILGEHGWPCLYSLVAASWAKPGFDPLSAEMEGATRFLGDPPGRQPVVRQGAYWGYRAVAKQQHTPKHLFLDLFLSGGQVIVTATNSMRVADVRLDLGTGKNALRPVLPEAY
jgi:hypothetical protein